MKIKMYALIFNYSLQISLKDISKIKLNFWHLSIKIMESLLPPLIITQHKLFIEFNNLNIFSQKIHQIVIGAEVAFKSHLIHFVVCLLDGENTY